MEKPYEKGIIYLGPPYEVPVLAIRIYGPDLEGSLNVTEERGEQPRINVRKKLRYKLGKKIEIDLTFKDLFRFAKIPKAMLKKWKTAGHIVLSLEQAKLLKEALEKVLKDEEK